MKVDEPLHAAIVAACGLALGPSIAGDRRHDDSRRLLPLDGSTGLENVASSGLTG